MKFQNKLYTELRQYFIHLLNVPTRKILYWEKVHKIWKLSEATDSKFYKKAKKQNKTDLTTTKVHIQRIRLG